LIFAYTLLSRLASCRWTQRPTYEAYPRSNTLSQHQQNNGCSLVGQAPFLSNSYDLSLKLGGPAECELDSLWWRQRVRLPLTLVVADGDVSQLTATLQGKREAGLAKLG
jgi:hypothetical protein